MAIAKTGAIFKTLTFDGMSSRNYGVYITGEAVYNAPERDVEMITIPGRNGSFAKDNGRFQNIEVTYPAGIAADSQTDFADAISDFRNMLCSRDGYCRLTDDYNPDEFRMAVYKSGLEVDPALLRAGEFEITFECKPQRFLTSGETKSTIANGGTITNPTRFPSKPLLEAVGYGDIEVGGGIVTIEDTTIGEILIASPKSGSNTQYTFAVNLDDGDLNAGDTISVPSILTGLNLNIRNTSAYSITTASKSNKSNCSMNFDWATDQVSLFMRPDPTTFAKGTSATFTASYNYSYKEKNLSTQAVTTYSGQLSLQIAYNGSSRIDYTISATGYSSNVYVAYGLKSPAITGISTKSINAETHYIDLDIGEAYIISNGSAVSINNVVELPAELPTLPSGVNTIAYSNTITSLKITPRWWKI